MRTGCQVGKHRLTGRYGAVLVLAWALSMDRAELLLKCVSHE